jgi:hypothetical protein
MQVLLDWCVISLCGYALQIVNVTQMDQCLLSVTLKLACVNVWIMSRVISVMRARFALPYL